jgi:hypothetical protein
VAFRKLIVRVEWIVEAARWFCDWAPLANQLELTAITDELRRFLQPVEFGHMVPLCQSPEKFITDHESKP